jgi:hypothetical protein
MVALVALVANPWWYETASFDIHMPPLGLPLLVYAGYALWSGRFRGACVAGLVSLLFGAVVAELVLVVGVAALCSRRVREARGAPWAAGLAAIGLAWIALVNVLGANQASNLATNYGYLAGAGQTSKLFGILKGAALHPSRVTHVLSMRWRAILFELLPTGFVGLITPWGFFLLIGLLVPVALTASFAYSSPTGGAFQNLPAMPFIFVGSVMVLTRVATWMPGAVRDVRQSGETGLPSHNGDPSPRSAGRRRWISDRRGPVVATAIATVATVIALAQGGIMIHRIPHDWLLVSATQAQTLENATVIIPSDAEVVVSYGVMGRFAERKYVLALVAAPQTFRVSTRTVFFVITPTLGNEVLDGTDAEADASFLHTHLHARSLIDENGVDLLEWAPPADTTTVVLPGAHLLSR